MLLQGEAELAVTISFEVLDHCEGIQKHFVYHAFGMINGAILISKQHIETKLVYGDYKVPPEMNNKLKP